MKNENFQISLSPQDKDKFGVRTARATEVSERDWPAILDFCRKNSIDFLIARCRTTNIRAAQVLEKEGCLLVDTLIHYVRNMIKIPIPPVPSQFPVRPIRVGEEKIVEKIAADAFRDYGGHYQSDERLPHIHSSKIYSSWALNSCFSRDHIHDVLICEYHGDIVGFITVRLNNPREGEGPLAGVITSTAKRSLILSSLSIGAMHWFRSKGASRCIASLLITNLVMQKIMSRLNFEPGESYYTFHKWF